MVCISAGGTRCARGAYGELNASVRVEISGISPPPPATSRPVYSKDGRERLECSKIGLRTGFAGPLR